ncbi:MAG TPA: hypothetical protein VEW67_07055 [Thermoleophilaceae bacterium]|nr:hypothetical protein [Thermoleophilaceae bacterium]
MAGRFEATVVIDRPIEAVFGFVANGENDRGHGLGKLIAPLALRAARKDADAFANRIKTAVEAP